MAHVNFIDKKSLEYGCTPFEAWQIRNSGFLPQNNQLLSAALGPLCSNSKNKDSEPVWILELLNVEVNSTGLQLTNPENFYIEKEESLLLLNSIKPTINNYNLNIDFISPKKWRLFLPRNISFESYSPSIVFEKGLNNFLKYDLETRKIRNLFNEIGITLNNHNINTDRITKGLPPINFLWLYGGAKPWNINKIKPDILFMNLHESYNKNNYNMWIDNFKSLDNIFKELSNSDNLPKFNINLILLGNDCCLELVIKKNKNWLKYFNIFNKNKWTAYLN
ncbi:hypothetical protein [Candidatus Kinetoplastidibacterium desouzai]|nr:hypothetical protein [Candidatus Kinetoplastibacterium desouzaii]